MSIFIDFIPWEGGGGVESVSFLYVLSVESGGIILMPQIIYRQGNKVISAVQVIDLSKVCRSYKLIVD